MANGTDELSQAIYGNPAAPPPAAPAPTEASTPPADVPAPQEGQQPGVTPPADNNELMARVAGWKRVMDRLASDPVSQMAIFRFSTALMQPVQPGQTNLGHVGGALNVGATSAQAMTEYTAQQANVHREQTRREAETNAQIKLQGAQTKSIAEKMPVEIESLRAQTRHANSESDILAVDKRIKEMAATIKEKYGDREAQAALEQLRAHSGYYDAMAKYAAAHARQANAVAGGMENDWQTQPTHDASGNITGYVSSNRKSNERQVTRIDNPLPMNEAVAKAKADVNSVKSRIKSDYGWGGGEPREQVLSQLTGVPGTKTEDEAVRILSDRYRQGGVATHRFDRHGVPLGLLTSANTPQAGAGGASPQPGGHVPARFAPVPENAKHLAMNSVVQDKPTGLWYQVTPEGMRPTVPPVNRAGGTPPSPDATDQTRYTRKPGRSGFIYSMTTRGGHTKDDWAAIDAGTRQEE